MFEGKETGSSTNPKLFDRPFPLRSSLLDVDHSEPLAAHLEPNLPSLLLSRTDSSQIQNGQPTVNRWTGGK